MLTAERHRAILRLLAEHGRITVADIAQRFDISHATARRDALSVAIASFVEQSAVEAERLSSVTLQRGEAEVALAGLQVRVADLQGATDALAVTESAALVRLSGLQAEIAEAERVLPGLQEAVAEATARREGRNALGVYLEAARAAGNVPVLVYASSAAVHGGEEGLRCVYSGPSEA
jgi:DeoR family fructose operon transcriptional repressor